MLKILYSYAHTDEALRDALAAHLSPLRREGRIATWHDRNIPPGAHVDNAIRQELDAADIILLLVSAAFLASEYCWHEEMTRAVARHEAGAARVIPVILRPCEWQHAPFGRLRATPRDGKPVTSFANHDEAFLQVARDIRQAVGELTHRRLPQPSTGRLPEEQRGPTPAPTRRAATELRVRRTFTDQEKDAFLEDAVATIITAFEAQLAGLSARNARIEGSLRRVDTNHAVARIYVNGQKHAACRIWQATGGLLSGILYADTDAGDDNAFNAQLRTTTDGYELGLEATGLLSFGGGPPPPKFMSPDQGANYLWGHLIRRIA